MVPGPPKPCDLKTTPPPALRVPAACVLTLGVRQAFGSPTKVANARCFSVDSIFIDLLPRVLVSRSLVERTKDNYDDPRTDSVSKEETQTKSVKLKVQQRL